MSQRILTPLDSSCSSMSVAASSVRSSMYEKPLHPPPLTPTRRLVFSAGRPCCWMMSLISLAADSLRLMGISCLLFLLLFVLLLGSLIFRLHPDALDRDINSPAGQ